MRSVVLDDHECPFRARVLELEAELAGLEAGLARRDATFEAELARRSAAFDVELAAVRAQQETWREKAETQQQRTVQLEEALGKINGELGVLRRRVFGQRREHVEPVTRELDKNRPKDPDETQRKRRETQRKRQEARTQRLAIPERTIPHEVPEADRPCPNCHAERLPLGTGNRTTLYESIVVQVERQIHVQEILKCLHCEDQIVTAPAPEKVFDKCLYGPQLMAHAIVAKCADAIPLNRQAKQFQRMGVPMARSTLGDLFREAARLLRPLAMRIQVLVALMDLLLADETTIQVLEKALKKTRRSYIWVFISLELKLTIYIFSPTRSGDTPSKILGASEGTLLVDAYSGYNAVCTPEGRSRAGCNGHMRRNFFDALESAPVEARAALSQILELYRVEHDALEQGIVGTTRHMELRQQRSKLIMAKLKEWLEQEQPKHLPKGPMGKAIGYALNQWEALTKFLEDVRIPLDNNFSERMLRIIALIRKNSLFVGNNAAGEDLAVLMTLVGSCILQEVNPEEYLADVLLKVSRTPLSEIDDLLPHNWKVKRAAEKALKAAAAAALAPVNC